jgi:hypothetical protein
MPCPFNLLLQQTSFVRSVEKIKANPKFHQHRLFTINFTPLILAIYVRHSI